MSIIYLVKQFMIYYTETICVNTIITYGIRLVFYGTIVMVCLWCYNGITLMI